MPRKNHSSKENSQGKETQSCGLVSPANFQDAIVSLPLGTPSSFRKKTSFQSLRVLTFSQTPCSGTEKRSPSVVFTFPCSDTVTPVKLL
ncbi:hypothetical protein SRHO_G00203530 [Serrasalmus rhombeus]